MRYYILRPPAPLDPRQHAFTNIEAMHAAMPKVAECELEAEAEEDVRHAFPDALAMPLPVRIGSGTTWMLGIIENISTRHDPDAEIPYVMFVQAVPERERERKLVSNNGHWSRKIWKAPVTRPAGVAIVTPIEIRASDLDNPMPAEASVGYGRDGRFVVYCSINGVELSLTFTEPGVGLNKTAAATEP